MKEQYADIITTPHQSTLIKEITSVLQNKPPIIGAYIFGSFLRSEIYHDIDIALYLNFDPEPYERFKFASKIGHDVEVQIHPRTHVDVRILNNAPITFAYEVLSTGLLLNCSNDEIITTFETDILVRYLDMQPWYETLDNLYREKLMA
ncbi:MAG: nucleotidyltransferase domain-containing protein [Methanobacteriota archaeon]